MTLSNKAIGRVHSAQQLFRPQGQETREFIDELNHKGLRKDCIYTGLALPDLITKTAIKFSQKTAVRFGESSLTYGDLESHSNKFANYLINKGIKPGDRIAISVNRSLELVITLLGILKTGACYIPLDPVFPLDRLEFMLQDCAATLLVTDMANSGRFVTANEEVVVNILNKELAGLSDGNSGISLHNNLPAYILYTSGSTGKPKGVEILHYNVVNFLTSMQDIPGITENDKLLAITTISFDIAGLEIYLPLISGAELIIAPDSAVKDGRQLIGMMTDISLMQATPSTWTMLLDSGWKGNKKIKALCGGEPLNRSLADRLLGRCGTLWNMYGPTETTIWSTVNEVKFDNKLITVGKPIANTQVYILGEQLQLMDSGEIGEIGIAGDGVAAGYINRPDLTAEKFVDFDIGGEQVKLYRTGDLGKFDPDGELLCLGRLDQQVKIRGHRIELGEIEQCILKIPEISQAVVVAPTAATGDPFICACIVLALNSVFAETDIKRWRDIIKESLPEFMIPAKFVIVEHFPTTPNGKTDRKLLAASVSGISKKDIFTSPETPLEETISKIWTETLNLPEISTTANFFELGGHSLVAIRVVSKIEQVTGISLPLASLFSYSTIRSLSAVIQSNLDAVNDTYQSLVPIKPGGTWNPLYIVHGGGLNVLLFNYIADKMHPEQPVYGLQPLGMNGKEEPLDVIEDIAAHYKTQILKNNPDGPYLLAGYSMGGMIAFEIAKQLTSMGKEVKLLAMLDAYAETLNGDKSAFRKQVRKLSQIIPKINFYIASFLSNPLHTYVYRREMLSSWFSRNFGRIKESIVNKKINKAFDRAFLKYRMTPYEGDIHVFKPRIHAYFREDREFLGWKPFTKREIKIHIVEGDHKYMLLPPNDEEFARVLQNTLISVSNQ